ncbi:AGAP013025-PA-like protein [Anopheles sinensis]|uniref:AGAP013025-PA-like protein n=1 Tax=Anopheles sinensis TaxID=74873 RepID=A0A084W014_ANOSI|nr:AGAP013025-PA-like protein [Anopheles sinensis]
MVTTRKIKFSKITKALLDGRVFGSAPKSMQLAKHAHAFRTSTLRLNLIVWFGCCLLLQAPWVVEAAHEPPPNGSSNRPTQLEDIERDNLNSERQVYKKEAIAQQGASSSQSNNHYSVQIQHHLGSTAGTHSAVKYVTPLPAPTQTLTYQKGIRRSIRLRLVSIDGRDLPPDHLAPIIGGSAPANPYLTPQPQYVYVQARPQQLPQYAADNNLPQSLLHILPQNSQ